ncbi:hypothetical protein KYI92_15550 [Pantoea allii]|uniref:Xanthine permease XanP n=1 Tax=Pantoea allii TaxID=574096 RepID=A0ABS6VH89_9GAMM|nr:hypothetical protein [Pantoea allii]MBW1258697.1 hypothetical protein [Pantoea allii]MBW1267381.1 hypothetical protein [Pantoea allii]MBW1289789.1 hypothetical protein [Pantoea allii]
MSDEKNSGLLYGLDQRIPPLQAFFSASQHVLAGLVAIVLNLLIPGGETAVREEVKQGESAQSL